MTTSCRTRRFLKTPLVHDTLAVSTRLRAQAGSTTLVPPSCGLAFSVRGALGLACASSALLEFSTAHSSPPLAAPTSCAVTAPHRACLRSHSPLRPVRSRLRRRDSTNTPRRPPMAPPLRWTLSPALG
ncbi:hypothetical protein C8R47DRAFT_1205849 [Mycena vitilis]|nr:hypothetical protein C8R47DRAFT_1205849 [Mycena vitilis]